MIILFLIFTEVLLKLLLKVYVKYLSSEQVEEWYSLQHRSLLTSFLCWAFFPVTCLILLYFLTLFIRFDNQWVTWVQVQEGVNRITY